MTALRIAFEAPDTIGTACPSASRPIDFIHLSQQTMGDKSLEIEVLQIFARQARQLMQELSSGVPSERQNIAHRMKGAALAIGASAVARTAADVEATPEDAGHLASLAAAVIEAELFILKLCR